MFFENIHSQIKSCSAAQLTTNPQYILLSSVISSILIISVHLYIYIYKKLSKEDRLDYSTLVYSWAIADQILKQKRKKI